MWSSPRINPGASSIFDLYVNDLHKVVKNAFLLLFIDDNNLSYTGNDMTDITEKNKWWLTTPNRMVGFK